MEHINSLLGEVDFNSRIKNKPYFTRFHNGHFYDSIRDNGEINYNGLNDHQKLCLYIFAWNTADILPGKKGIFKKFGWTNNYLQNLIKELEGAITTEATFDEHTGLLSGSGYLYYEFRDID